MVHHRHGHHAHVKLHTTPAYVSDFIALLLPIARDVKTRWGVSIAVLIAQGALESAWGRHVKGNAYFGIKGRSPAGKSVEFGTHEFAAGSLVSTQASFRAYTSLADAADDYGRFLRHNPRYATAFAYSDQPYQFIDAVANAGYATDPDYASKIKSIIRVHRLDQYDVSKK
jgi:flagellar protein FlgJ